MNLNVEFDGLKLKNPLMPASGPLSGDLEKLRFMQDQGVGAVVTKTISSAGAKVPRPCIYGDKYFIMNSELWSEHPKEVWLNEILPKYDKSDGRPLIVSVGYTKEDVAMLIPLLEPFADAFEVSTHYVGKELSFIEETVRTIRGKTNKPVYMKISPNMDDPIAFAEAVREAGASGIAAINTLGPTLKIDINSRQIVYGGENGFVWTSGPAIKNLALATVYKIKQAMPDFTVIGIGGIASADDVIEFLLAGANGVQMLSAALLKGKNLYSKVIENLPKALEKYGFRSIQEVVDTSLSRSISYDPIIPTVDIDTCVKCMLCEKICPYFAITIEEHPVFNKTKCFGCHLCVSKCPTKSIEVR